jgi:hypothetical protein
MNAEPGSLAWEISRNGWRRRLEGRDASVEPSIMIEGEIGR